MMPEDHRLPRGHIVDIVLQLPAGNLGCRIEPEDTRSNPAPIRVIGDNEANKRCERYEQSEHVEDHSTG